MKISRLVTLSFAVLALASSSLSLGVPAQAAVTLISPASVSSAQSAPTSPRADIDWDNALRVFNSYVECVFNIPRYELMYFPASIACVPYGNTTVMVIVKWF